MGSRHWKGFLFILGFVVAGCWNSGYKRVDFSAILPTEKPHEEPALAQPEIRVAVAAMLKSKAYPWVERMLDALPDPEAFIDLQVDHTRLFAGAFSMVSAPYGSVYLEGRRVAMCESTMVDVQLFFQDHLGRSIEPLTTKMTDHAQTYFTKVWLKPPLFL